MISMCGSITYPHHHSKKMGEGVRTQSQENSTGDLASHADVLRGSSRIPAVLFCTFKMRRTAHSFFGNDCTIVVCTANINLTFRLNSFHFLMLAGEQGNVVDLRSCSPQKQSMVYRLESATLVEIPEGLGGSSVPDKNGKTQGGWGSEISSLVGVWIFSGTT